MTPCPPIEELSRQIASGDPGPLAEHLRECAACRSEWEGAALLKSLLRELPDLAPEGPHVPEMRERVLHAVQKSERTRRVRRVGTWVGFVAAAAAILFVSVSPLHTGGRETASVSHATLLSAPGTVFERVRSGPTEVVQLSSGSLHVDVTPLTAGERFIVHAGDADVEVRGTSFDVAVKDGKLAGVSVTYGRVEVRAPGVSPVFLAAGEAWSRPGDVLAVPVPSAEAVPAPSASAPAEKKSAVAPRPGPSAAPSASPADAPLLPEVPALLPAPALPAAPAPELPEPLPVVPAPTVLPTAPQNIDPGSSREEQRRERLEERRERAEPRRR